jgi:hypothetical protein
MNLGIRERGFLALHYKQLLHRNYTHQQDLLPPTLISPTASLTTDYSYNMNFKSTISLLIAVAAAPAVVAGPLGYAICQTGKVNERDPCPPLIQSLD